MLNSTGKWNIQLSNRQTIIHKNGYCQYINYNIFNCICDNTNFGFCIYILTIKAGGDNGY